MVIQQLLYHRSGGISRRQTAALFVRASQLVAAFDEIQLVAVPRCGPGRGSGRGGGSVRWSAQGRGWVLNGARRHLRCVPAPADQAAWAACCGRNKLYMNQTFCITRRAPFILISRERNHAADKLANVALDIDSVLYGLMCKVGAWQLGWRCVNGL